MARRLTIMLAEEVYEGSVSASRAARSADTSNNWCARTSPRRPNSRQAIVQWPPMSTANERRSNGSKHTRMRHSSETGRTARLYPSEALVLLGATPHKAMADQVRTVAKERLGRFIAALSPSDLLAVEQAIKQQLGLR